MSKIETAPKRGGVLKNLWFLISTFSRPTQVRLVLYLCAQALISLMDMVGIAMVLPVTQVLMGADLDQGYLGVAHRMVGNPSTRTFTIELCVAMVLAFLIKAVVGTWLSWWSTGFVARLSVGTSSRLLRAFLHEDYLSHKRRDVAEVIRNVGPAVQSAHTQSLGGMMNLSGLVFSSVTVMIRSSSPRSRRSSRSSTSAFSSSSSRRPSAAATPTPAISPRRRRGKPARLSSRP